MKGDKSQSRASTGISLFNDGAASSIPNSILRFRLLLGKDPSCAGHGTHVAGVVGGLRYGVAKDVNIVMGTFCLLMRFNFISLDIHAVEVQPCTSSGSLRYVLKGLDWLMDNAKKPAVAQMSLVALGKSQSLNRMVEEVIDAGIPFVVSAGNYGAGNEMTLLVNSKL